MTKAIGVQVLVVGAAVAGAASDSDWGQFLGLGTAGAGQLYLMSYSRANESEADWLGLRYMTHLGYNPVGQIQVMEILRAAGGGGARPNGSRHIPRPTHASATSKNSSSKNTPTTMPRHPSIVLPQTSFKKTSSTV